MTPVSVRTANAVISLLLAAVLLPLILSGCGPQDLQRKSDSNGLLCTGRVASIVVIGQSPHSQ